MRIHHLDCGNGNDAALSHARVLVLETETRLILIDAGFGLGDVANPARMGGYGRTSRLEFNDQHTAFRQLEALGLDPSDVSDIILTHGDPDHAGGISDFPRATVHLTHVELQGVRDRPTLMERGRYPRGQWAHSPTVIGHRPGNRTWQGFHRVRALDHLVEGLRLVQLLGHSRGHAGVAVPTGDGWLFHTGDAFLSGAALEGQRPGLGTRAMERVMAFDAVVMRATQQRLLELQAGGQVTCLASHSPVPDTSV